MSKLENEDVNFEEEADEFYDKFNELTFIENFKNGGDFTFTQPNDMKDIDENLKSLEIVPREIDLQSLVTSAPNESCNSSVCEPERIYSMFQMPVHPLLMLSTAHRRLFPCKREASLCVGRYDPLTKYVKCMIYDSVVMDSFDKQENLKMLMNGLIFHNDRLPHSGMRDYYYWKRAFNDDGFQRCSNVVKYEHVVNNFGPIYTDARDTIIKIGPSLGCLSRTSPTFPRLSLDLPKCGNRISAVAKASSKHDKYLILAAIETLHKYALNIELLSPLNHSQRSIFNDFWQDGHNKISSILLNQNSHQLIKKILEYEKGRMSICRCITALNHVFQLQVQIISLLMYTLHSFSYNEIQFIEIYFHKGLTDVIFGVLRKVELPALGNLLEMMLNSSIPLMHTFVGLSLHASILSQLVLKSNLHEKDINIAKQFVSSLKNCIQDINKLAPYLVTECKIRIQSIVEICTNIKASSLNDELIQLTVSLRSFLD